MIHRAITRLLMFFCCFSLAQFAFGQADSLLPQIVYAKKTDAKVPVVPFYDTLFYVNCNLGSFSAEERATSIAKTIKKISKESRFQQDSIKVISFDNIAEVVYKNTVIMGITPTDAFINETDILSLAHEYEKIIRDAIFKHKLTSDWKYLLVRISLALLILVALFFMIRLVNWLYRKIIKNMEASKWLNINSFKIKSFNFLNNKWAKKLIIFCFKILQILAILLLCYFAITTLFSVFPPTRGIADKLFGYILNPLQKIGISIVEYIPNLIKIIIIILVFRYLIKGLRFIAGELNKGRLTLKGFYSDWAFPTFRIIKVLLYIFMFILIFPLLPGSESKVFQGVSVFIGVVFSLGASSIINNVISGLVITYMRPFRVGDRIKIGDVVGNVTEKSPFVTRIRTPKNEEVTIPNSSILSAQTFNYTHSAKNHKLILHTEVTYGYDVHWKKIHELLLEAAARTSNILQEPKPFVWQTALDDYCVEYQINVYILEADLMGAIYSELNQHILDASNEAGVEIMSPAYSAHRDGNQVTIPPEYLPKDYKAPAINVKVSK
jgi:small-conductance mechanosensitive channel